jgi:anti-anti-sigma factor
MFERIASEGGRVRLHLKGALDSGAWDGLREGFEALAAAPSGDVVLDLSNVCYLDGPGIAAIGFLFKRLRAKGRRLTIAGANGQPLTLLHAHGLAELFVLPDRRARKRSLLRRLAWKLGR